MLRFQMVNVNGVELHYVEAPGPGPALVILHGLTGSHTEFLHLLPQLTKQAHVYLLDLRGHGLSGRSADGYQLADYADDVTAFLQQVVGQPAILVGHSLGAMVAVWLAVHDPHLLHALCLVDLPFYILQMPRFAETGFYPYFSGLRDYLNQVQTPDASFAEMVAYVRQSPVDGEQGLLDVASPAAICNRAIQLYQVDHRQRQGIGHRFQIEDRALQLYQVDPAALEPIFAGTLLGQPNPDELLAQIRCPVHLLAGQSELGGAMNSQDVERAVSQMPHATHAVIEGADHDIHLSQPEAFVRELKGFLAAIREQVT